MEHAQQYLWSYLGDTAYKIEPTDVKNIFWVELQDSTTIDEITKKISSIKDVEIIKGITLKQPFENLGIDADEGKRRGKTTIKVKSNISNLEGGGSMAEEGVELSPKERGRLDELQKKEDIDNFNESLKKGGANEHLGTNYRVTDAKIINQKTGEEIDFYKAPTFETFSEGAALSDKFNVPIWQGGLYYLKLDNLIRDNYNKTMKIKGYFKDGIRVMENTDFPLANQQLIDIPFNVLADFIESGRFKIANVVYETERDKKLLQNEINTILDAYKVATTEAEKARMEREIATTEAEKARLAREVATTEAEKAQIETDYSKQLLNMGDSINKLKQEFSDTLGGMEAMAGGYEGNIYKLGDKYSSSFDYEGMLKMGLKTDITWNIEDLEKLFSSYEDVNYHTEAAPLYIAILHRKGITKTPDYYRNEPEYKNEKMALKEFHKRIKMEINRQGGSLSISEQIVSKINKK